MNDTGIVKPAVKPKVKIEKAVKRKLLSKIQEEKQVIVHCSFKGTHKFNQIRIWKSTFLIPKGFKKKCKMIHFENITGAPTWTTVMFGKTHHFTLIFEGLPQGCTVFDLIESIDDSAPFVCLNIRRNKTDVYNVSFNN